MISRVVGLFVLQGLDLLSTWQGLRAGAAEQNPVGLALLGGGFAGLVAAKLAGTILIVALASWLWSGSRQNQTQARVVLSACCVFMIAVVGWNAAVILARA